MARHISSLTTFLDQYEHGFSDDELSKRLNRTAILLRNPPYPATAAQPTRSRHQLAQKCLFNIRKEFGDSVYYLCLFVSTITTLSTERKQLNDALAQWPGKNGIPSAFTKQAQAIVEKHQVEKQTEERPFHTPPRKRCLSTTRIIQKSSAEDSENTLKRARLEGGFNDLMSVGRMVVQSDQGENEGGTSQLGSDFNASYQGSLDVRNECSLGYHRLYTNTRSNLASQLATGNPQLPHGPETDTAGREADPDHRAGDNTIAECADSDESDDEEDPPLSEPVNSISPVDPFHPQDGMTPHALLLTPKCLRVLSRRASTGV
ncbi:hypothetical protein LY76DRAFT_595927 [Colletotrichum caudatum]|nr:hypothetical protein LY76DRAFT_595927 [Colletotrichum caudatum]